MIERSRDTLYRALRWSERYTKTDMVYLAYSGFWSNLNSIAVTLFSLVLYIAYAHFLNKEAYGTYQYLLSFFSIATAFTLTGMNAAVTRAVAQGYEGTLRASVRTQLVWGLIPFAGALALGGYYLAHGNTLLATGLFIIAAGTPVLYAFNTYGALFGGRKDFKRLTLFSLVYNVAYYSTLVLAAIYLRSPLLILGVNLFTQAALALALYCITLRLYRPNDSVDRGALSYGIHLSLMEVFGSVAEQLESIFTYHFLGPVSLAVYSFATAVPDRLSATFFKFLSPAALPKFSERSPQEIRSGLRHKMLIAYGIGFLVCIVSLLAIPVFFYLFFPSYKDALPYALVYSLTIILGAAHFLPSTALTALKKTKELYIASLLTPMGQIIFPLVGILSLGLWGLVLGRMASLLFGLIVTTSLVYYARE